MYLCQSAPFRCTQRYQTGYNYDGEVIVSRWGKVYCAGVCEAVTHSVSYSSLYHCLAVTRIIKCHQMLSNSIDSIFHWGGLSTFCSRFSFAGRASRGVLTVIRSFVYRPDSARTATSCSLEVTVFPSFKTGKRCPFFMQLVFGNGQKTISGEWMGTLDSTLQCFVWNASSRQSFLYICVYLNPKYYSSH